MDFGSILGAMFDQSFKFFQKTPKARSYRQNNEKSMILHLQSLHFPIKTPSEFQTFANTPSRISFFQIFDAP
jgi:hypothetical protein